MAKPFDDEKLDLDALHRKLLDCIDLGEMKLRTATVSQLIAAARRLEWLEADLRKSVVAWRSSAACLEREVERGIAIRQSEESKLSRTAVLRSNADELERKLEPNSQGGK